MGHAVSMRRRQGEATIKATEYLLTAKAWLWLMSRVSTAASHELSYTVSGAPPPGAYR